MMKVIPRENTYTESDIIEPSTIQRRSDVDAAVKNDAEGALGAQGDNNNRFTVLPSRIAAASRWRHEWNVDNDDNEENDNDSEDNAVDAHGTHSAKSNLPLADATTITTSSKQRIDDDFTDVFFIAKNRLLDTCSQYKTVLTDYIAFLSTDENRPSLTSETTKSEGRRIASELQHIDDILDRIQCRLVEYFGRKTVADALWKAQSAEECEWSLSSKHSAHRDAVRILVMALHKFRDEAIDHLNSIDVRHKSQTKAARYCVLTYSKAIRDVTLASASMSSALFDFITRVHK